MKQVKCIVYFTMNKEQHIRTKTLTRRLREEEAEVPNKGETIVAAEHLILAEMVFLHGPKTMIEIKNVRFQIVEEIW